jgi:hypothetical protein
VVSALRLRPNCVKSLRYHSASMDDFNWPSM